jgi:hypothetical protein
MKKGTQAPAPMSKPTEGKMGADVTVSGGKVTIPYAGAPKPGKMVKKSK